MAKDSLAIEKFTVHCLGDAGNGSEVEHTNLLPIVLIRGKWG
jgi:hypothetical protein